MSKWLERGKERKRTVVQIEQLKKEVHEAFTIWDSMLCKKKFITVIEAQSSEELTDKYNEFLQTNDNGYGRLGSIWSIDNRKFNLSDGKYIFKIVYTSFALKEHFTPEAYYCAIASYEDLVDKVSTLREDLDCKIGMPFREWCELMLSEDAEFKHVPYEERIEWYGNYRNRFEAEVLTKIED